MQVPVVDPIVLPGAEVVVLGPFDRPAAQALEIDLQVLHRRQDLGRRRRPAGAFQRRLDHQAGDPALGQLLVRVCAGLLRRIGDLFLDRQIVLEQGVGADHVELGYP